MATEVVKIVDTGGTGDYSSLAAWEAGEQKDLITADEIAVADCRCTDGSADTDPVTIDGWTTNEDCYIKIWTDPDQGYRHDGKWNTEKYRLEVVDHDALLVYEDCVQIIGLQIFADDPDGGRKNVYLLSANAPNKSVVAYNILKGNGTASSAVIKVSDADRIVDIYNNAGYDSKRGIEIADADTINIYNNTFYGANISGSVGILVSAGTVIVKNCAVFNNSDDFSGTMTIDYCASDDGDGTNAVIPSNWDDVFDVANRDFHLKSTDTDLRDAGTDLSSDPYLAFTDDIDGETRSAPWDIGADEYVSSVTTQTISAYIDSLLKRTDIESSFYIDSVLLKSFSVNISIDSLLSKISELTTDIDSILKLTDVVEQIDIDAILKDLNVNITSVIDSILKSTNLTTSEIDAVIKEIGTELNLNADAILKLTNAITSSKLDAVLKEVEISKAYFIDAVLKKITGKSTNIDSVLKAIATSANVSVDSILLKNYVKYVSVDAVLKLLGITPSTSIDSILKGLGISINTNLDAILQSTGQQTIISNIDAILKYNNVQYSCDLDALLQSQGVVSLTYIDALLKYSNDVVTLLDALLKAQFTSLVDIDALLKQSDKTTIVDIDSILTINRTGNFLIDSILKGTILRDIVLDAQLKKNQSVNSFIDGLLSRISSIQTNIDAILTSGGGLVSINIDGLLKRTSTLVTILDAILRSPGMYPRYKFKDSDRVNTLIERMRDKILTEQARTFKF